MRRDIDLGDKTEAQNNGDRGRGLNRSLGDGNNREFPAQPSFLLFMFDCESLNRLDDTSRSGYEKPFSCQGLEGLKTWKGDLLNLNVFIHPIIIF